MQYHLRVGVLALACAVGGCSDESESKPTDPRPIASPSPSPAPEPEPGPGSGWVAQSSGTSAYLGRISAVDTSHAWATGQLISVKATDDGGASWASRGPLGFRGIQFLDELNGWAIAQDAVFSTSDGGNTWTFRLAPASMPESLSFVSSATGWVSTQQGTLYKTTDGGQSWSSVSMGRWLGTVEFVNGQVGWMVSNVTGAAAGGAILKSMDGGATWADQLIVEGDSTFFADLSAVSESHAWAVGRLGSDAELIVSTSDGGSTWTERHSDGSSMLKAVHFVDADRGWTVGQKIHCTSDGGATWKIQPNPMNDALGFYDVVFVNATTGWVVGGHGAILKTTTGGE